MKNKLIGILAVAILLVPSMSFAQSMSRTQMETLLQALEKELIVLEQELATQAMTPPVAIQEQVPLGAAPTQATPTSTASGSPIVYTGEQDTEPAPVQATSCVLTVDVTTSTPTQTDIALFVPLSPQGYMVTGNAYWTTSGLPAYTTGTLNDYSNITSVNGTGNTIFNGMSLLGPVYTADFGGTECSTTVQ